MFFTRWFRAIFGASPSSLDPTRAARLLRIEANARRDAQRNEGAVGPSPAELEIDRHFNEHLRVGIADIASRLRALQTLQSRLRHTFEHPVFDDRVAAFDGAAASLKAAFGNTAVELKRAEQQQQIDFNAVREEAGLNRQPIEPRSLALHGSMLCGFVVVEALANSPFLAAGHVLGLAGGLAVAMCVAALNVFLAARAGVILRYVNHVLPRFRVMAVLFGVSYGGLLLAFHLGVAHWRNALAGLILNVRPHEAGRAALAALMQMPFNLLTIESVALVLIGVTFALVALVASYRAADPYPGYSDAAARLRSAAAALREHKDNFFAGLNAIFEGEGRRGSSSAEAQLEAIAQGAEQAASDYSASAAQTLRLQQECRAYPAQVEAARAQCHARYRSVYRAVRGNAPARMAEPPAPLPVPDIDLLTYTPPPIDERAQRAQVATGHDLAKARVRALQRQYLDEAPALFAALGLEPGAPPAAAAQAVLAAAVPDAPVINVAPAPAAIVRSDPESVLSQAGEEPPAAIQPPSDGVRRRERVHYRTWIAQRAA